MTRDRITLGELVGCCQGEIRTGPFGSQLHKSDYVDNRDATPVVMPKDMVDGRIDTASIARIDEATRQRLSQHVLQAGDIVLARRGDIGRRAWVDDDQTGWLCGTGSMRISLRDCPQLRTRYLHYYLATDDAIGWLEGHAVGATMSNLSAGVVEQLPVEAPEVAYQDLVVGILDSIEALIENNRRRIEILEEMVRLIYREWFVHFRFPGHDHAELVDSDLGPIPEGWGVDRLQDLQSTGANATAAGPFGSKLGRKDYIEEPGIPVIRGSNLRLGGGFVDDGFVYVSERKAETLTSSLARRGDVVVTQRGTLGQVALIPESSTYDAYVMSQSQMKFTADEDRIHPVVIYMQLASPEGTQRVQDIATGSGVPHINLTMFREMRFLVPPVPLQRELANTIAPMLQLTNNLVRQTTVLAEARDLLLPRLISGELDVSDLDLDLEPVG